MGVFRFDDGRPDWDVATFATPLNQRAYLARVTSEHRKPKFLALVGALVQPLADLVDVLDDGVLYDLDAASGARLDRIGEWIGVTRRVDVPIVPTYFVFDVTDHGWDESRFRGPTPPNFAAIDLLDDDYRRFLRARIRANRWNGTIDYDSSHADAYGYSAYEIWDALYAGTGKSVRIIDFNNLTMRLSLVGGPTTPLDLAFMSGRYLNTKPAGIRLI